MTSLSSWRRTTVGWITGQHLDASGGHFCDAAGTGEVGYTVATAGAIRCPGQYRVPHRHADAAVVNIALPVIKEDFRYNHTGISWVVNSYLIAFAGLLLAAGRLAGYARAATPSFIAGTLVFTIGSAGSGMAVEISGTCWPAAPSKVWAPRWWSRRPWR
ncbi:MAG: hypothetical protein WKF73_10345 [Nocardioidaceae bacterium]